VDDIGRQPHAWGNHALSDTPVPANSTFWLG